MPIDNMGTELNGGPASETEVKKAPRAMIVEDTILVGGTIKDFLQDNGIDVEGDCYYVNGQGAIDALGKRKSEEPPIDFLITDIGLEDGDTGIKVIEAFRGKYPDSKIIILTGSMEKAKEAYTSQQLIDNKITLMEKPFKLGNFRQTLAQMNILVPQQNKSNQ